MSDDVREQIAFLVREWSDEDMNPWDECSDDPFPCCGSCDCWNRTEQLLVLFNKEGARLIYEATRQYILWMNNRDEFGDRDFPEKAARSFTDAVGPTLIDREGEPGRVCTQCQHHAETFVNGVCVQCETKNWNWKSERGDALRQALGKQLDENDHTEAVARLICERLGATWGQYATLMTIAYSGEHDLSDTHIEALASSARAIATLLEAAGIER